MQAPTCKVCGAAHWMRDPHVFKAVTKPETVVPETVPETVTVVPVNRGRPRKWASETERKRAYRQRSKA